MIAFTRVKIVPPVMRDDRTKEHVERERAETRVWTDQLKYRNGSVLPTPTSCFLAHSSPERGRSSLVAVCETRDERMSG